MASKAQTIAQLQELIDSGNFGRTSCASTSSCLDVDLVEGRESSEESDEGSGEQQKTPEKAFSRILRMVSHRERCSYDIRVKLLQEGYPEGAAETALERAVSLRIVDDVRFAESFIVSSLHAGKGRRGIACDLVQKGIQSQDVERLMFEHSSDFASDYERAMKLLDTHPPRSKNVRDGAYRKLIAKGYSSEIASFAARTYEERLRNA